MNKIKAILLEGGNVKEIMLSNDPEENGKEIRDILGVDDIPAYLSFGQGYTMFWQDYFEEKISVILTHTAGFDHPIFIQSKVLIVNSDPLGVDEEHLLDVDIEELKTYFNTEGDCWAFMKFD